MTQALAVFAHHDDHILWAGGAIQRMRRTGWEWTIVALCVPDVERQRYFQGCCDALGVEARFSAFLDYGDPPAFHVNSKPGMLNKLLGLTSGRKFDYVFTHSRFEHGEYGFHANHAEVQSVVTSAVADGALEVPRDRLAYVTYRAIYGTQWAPTVATLGAPYYLQLDYAELMQKCDWCSRAPDADSSLKNLGYPCPSPEAFEGDGLDLPSDEHGSWFLKH